MLTKIKCGLSLMPTPDFLRATFPLFEEGLVEALEWSFDSIWPPRETKLPDWAFGLIKHYGENNQLYGHGVFFSLLSGNFTSLHEDWLQRLEEECKRNNYRHISEHFGFMRAGSFLDSAPLPVPFTTSALALGQERLGLMQERCGNLAIGLENLAFAFCKQDVSEQGAFLSQLLEPCRGFLLLDLHNLYCQMVNFKLSAQEILADYPVAKIKELHLSGGSWSHSASNSPIRRDTHDQAVPKEVFELLAKLMPLFPNLEIVILERMGGTIYDAKQEAQLVADYKTMKTVVEEKNAGRS